MSQHDSPRSNPDSVSREEISDESLVGRRPTGLSIDKLICPKDKPVGDFDDDNGPPSHLKKITFQPFRDKDYDCPLCQSHIKHRWQLRKHLKEVEQPNYSEDHPYQTEIKDYLEQLEINPDSIPEGTKCHHCQKDFSNKYTRHHHLDRCRSNPISPNYEAPIPPEVQEYLDKQQLTVITPPKNRRKSPKTSEPIKPLEPPKLEEPAKTPEASTLPDFSEVSKPSESSKTPEASKHSDFSDVSKPSESSESLESFNDPDVDQGFSFTGTEKMLLLRHPLFNLTTDGPRSVTVEPLYQPYIAPLANGDFKITFDLDTATP